MEEKGFRTELRPEEHVLQISNREQVTVQGVIEVDSFDDQEIVLSTELGTLTLRGEELHIKQLDLASGRFAVEGVIHAALYSAARGRSARGAKGKGLFERLLK